MKWFQELPPDELAKTMAIARKVSPELAAKDKENGKIIKKQKVVANQLRIAAAISKKDLKASIESKVPKFVTCADILEQLTTLETSKERITHLKSIYKSKLFKSLAKSKLIKLPTLKILKTSIKILEQIASVREIMFTDAQKIHPVFANSIPKHNSESKKRKIVDVDEDEDSDDSDDEDEEDEHANEKKGVVNLLLLYIF
jgi:hypothetical protein